MKKETNLPQYVSSAPMALASQNDFSAHQPTKYPFKKGEGLSPVFKVILNSQSAVVNTNTNTYTFTVDFSKVEGDKLRCGIASLISNGNIVGTSVFNLHMNPLIQARSFDSRTRGIADMVFTGRQGVDYVFPVNQIDCNIELDGNIVRQTGTLTFYFTDFNALRIAALNTWQLVLYFYEAN